MPALSALTPPRMRLRGIVEDGADLREIGVRRVGRVVPSAKSGGCRRESGRAVLGRQAGEGGIVVDDIENVEVAVVQRSFSRGDTAERSAAVTDAFAADNAVVMSDRIGLNVVQCRAGRIARR